LSISKTISFHFESALNAYAQIFFTKNRAAAVFIILASFVSLKLGLWGLLAVILTNSMAHLFGFDKPTIREGLFGLNSLLVVFGLAMSYEVNGQFLLIFFATCLLTLLVSVAALYYLASLGLPFLSIPFLLGLCTMLLAIRQYSGMELSEGTVFFLNDLFAFGGTDLVHWYEKFKALAIPEIFGSYFKSLAAIIFQGNILAGALLALGILLSSRIAFSLTLIGYLTGYGFYYFVGADFTQLHYAYIGFNFILTAIAIGGFFFIPNWKTYLLVIVTAPLIAMLIAAFSALFLPFQLPIYSLPFVVMVLMVIYATNFNKTQGIHFQKVTHQQYSPEKNLYAYQNYRERFEGTTYFKIGLPFFGEWQVSQAHAGEHTHKGEWQHAWDFVIQDEEGNTFRDSGLLPEQYYCYNLPIIAPAAGQVVEILDEVPDNEIGEVNVQQNWGNTIVLKHAEYLYSKMSHLKAGSFEVKVGDYVKKGELLAHLGNSGRSPEPHLHFQIQATPFVGSKTLKYPLAYYMLKKKKLFEFNYFDYPKEGQLVFNIKTTALLEKAFDFKPGKVLGFEVAFDSPPPPPPDPLKGEISPANKAARRADSPSGVGGEGTQKVKWEVFTNALNQTYIYCHSSKSYAYFVKDDSLFYFTSFEGDRKSLLYYFYIGAYKVLLGFYKNMKIEDVIPLHLIKKAAGRWLQDVLAPFKIYHSIRYNLEYVDLDDAMRPKEIKLHARVQEKRFQKIRKQIDFTISLKNNQLHQFEVVGEGVRMIAKQVSEKSNQSEAVSPELV